CDCLDQLFCLFILYGKSAFKPNWVTEVIRIRIEVNMGSKDPP
ncbi:12703_t:CDS:1, partial [Acaulospora colombiana]